MNHRRSTRMRVHLQRPECNNDCTLTSGSASKSEGNGGRGCNEQPNPQNQEEKISFISCARGYPVDPAAADFPFSPPDLAPTFRPTEEEFAAGPIKYISKIRPFAEPYGICKIIPPASFKPKFAVDKDDFTFTPRVQRLNELEAKTRLKMNFLEQVIKFWDLQGSQLKIPYVEKRPLDLHALHTVVQEEGGFEICTRDRKWSNVAVKMNYTISRQTKGPVASVLRQHYERLLFPYDVLMSGATIGSDGLVMKPKSTHAAAATSDNNSQLSPDLKHQVKSEAAAEDKANQQERELPSSQLPPRPEGEPTRPRSRRKAGCQEESENEPDRKILRSSPRKNPGTIAGRRMQGPAITRTRRSVGLAAPPAVSGNCKALATIMNLRSSKELKKLQACVQCGDDSKLVSSLVTCIDCSKRYHMHCLIPALIELPRGDWHCPRCIAFLVQSQPQPFTHEFGFAQSQREYSLTEFAAVADKFKSDYFRMKAKEVPLDVVEKEFWRIMSSMEDAVTVEYGADLQNNEYGSGFAAECGKNLSKNDRTYLQHPWNLNNLPVAEGSLFKYVNQNISGMIVPWMYVGMCFSTFCWHNEDHWSYSINYLHWGEAKSWYGVPGDASEQFESAIKRIAPELFHSQPDLLQQLVTICNPNPLQQAGVPIYRCHQMPGEFVVTFPRSYHAGYNQGMNFAEAVNFAPADWLPIGRSCVSHYASLSRYPVFSHDELICKMANDPHLDPNIAQAAYLDALSMVESEKELRKDALDWGLVHAEQELYELLPDDERQCEVCKTTCFLSAVTCMCSPNKLVCIPDRDKLCNTCEPVDHHLKYRYTLDELPDLLHKLRSRLGRSPELTDNKPFPTNTLPESGSISCDVEHVFA